MFDGLPGISDISKQLKDMNEFKAELSEQMERIANATESMVALLESINQRLGEE